MDLSRELDRSEELGELAADVLDTLEDEFYIVDGEGRFIHANRRARETWRLPHGSIVGRTLLELLPEMLDTDGGERLRQAVQAFRKAEFDAFSPMLRAWLRVRACPLRADLVGFYLRNIDERMRADSDLKSIEERLRIASQAARLGYWERDLTTGELRSSDQCKANYGLPPDAELGYAAVFAAIHPEYREQVREASRRAVRDGTAYESEYPISWPDGSTHWISVRGQCIYDQDGNPLRTVGVTLDITERKRLEQELKESEERYRLFAEAATEGVLVHDFETVLDVSSRFAEIFGYRPEELIGTPLAAWPLLVEPDELAGALQLGRAGQVARNELACFRRDGAPIALEYSAKDVSYRGRRVRIMIARDVTERKRLERRMRELNERLEQQVEERARQLSISEARLGAFFANSFDRITLQRLTADGRWLYEDINPTCERAYGMTRAEVYGRTLEDVLGEEAAQVPLHYFRECVRTGVPQHYLVRRTMAGQTRLMDVIAVLVPGESDDGDRFVITIARDITEREKLEAQLRQAQKMEAVGQLTGGVAHDFNNLLTAVVSSLELIQTKSSEERVRRLADIALRAAMRGGELTHQLLSFSRRQSLRPAVVELSALLRETEALLRHAAGETVEMSIETEAGAWPCEVDPAQFQAAVMNLVVNARDAMPNGGRLALSIRNDTIRAREGGFDLPIGDYVVLSVSDTGEGMTEDVLAHVFEPFFTTKEIGKGSGLGLSMVHGFARQSGGAVRIESEPGSGTTVRLYLPRAWAGVSEERQSEHEPIKLPRSSGTVLVVEDNEDVLHTTVDVLRSLNYRVFVASSGPQALEVIRRGEKLDLLLTDIVMPAGMSGIELAHKARQWRPSIKVLLMSGYPGEAFQAPGQEFPFLAKPYRASELGRIVSELLQPAPASA